LNIPEDHGAGIALDEPAYYGHVGCRNALLAQEFPSEIDALAALPLPPNGHESPSNRAVGPENRPTSLHDDLKGVRWCCAFESEQLHFSELEEAGSHVRVASGIKKDNFRDCWQVGLLSVFERSQHLKLPARRLGDCLRIDSWIVQSQDVRPAIDFVVLLKNFEAG